MGFTTETTNGITIQKFEFPMGHEENLQDWARFSTHFVHLHEMLPYPLLINMCRKCHVLETEQVGNLNFGPVNAIYLMSILILSRVLISGSVLCIQKLTCGMHTIMQLSQTLDLHRMRLPHHLIVQLYIIYYFNAKLYCLDGIKVYACSVDDVDT